MFTDGSLVNARVAGRGGGLGEWPDAIGETFAMAVQEDVQQPPHAPLKLPDSVTGSLTDDARVNRANSWILCTSTEILSTYFKSSF